jgi:hypothetical protein
VTEFAPPRAPDCLARENPIGALNAWPVLSAIPSSFEARYAGATLEIETGVSEDGRQLRVALTAQHTRFQTWRSFDFAEVANGKRLSLSQPIFHTMKNVSTIPLRNGEKILLGAHKLPEPAKTFELFLLDVTATPATGAK